MEMPKERKMTKYGINVAKKMWGDELKNGIIEPKKKMKTDKNILGGEKLSLLKSNLLFIYFCPYFCWFQVSKIR